MEWRRRWARSWDRVRYCSAACRRQKVTPVDHELELAILSLLARRSRGASICPSEAARILDQVQWRPLMEPARRAARRLAAEGRVAILQRGRIVDGSVARGPIRLRLAAV
jgi:hypothetical protein